MLITIVSVLTPWVGHTLHEFDPIDLHSDVEAAQHVWSARIASAAAGVDADELLADAWHESRFTSNVVAPEPGGRVSCGIGTPEPVTHCQPMSLVGQYVALARHVRGWYEAEPHHRWAAWAGVAGGYALIQACVQGRGPRRGCGYGNTIADIMRRMQ